MDGWVVVDRCLCDGGTVGWVCVVGSGVIGWGPVGLLGVWCSGRGPADHGADAGADWLRLVLFRFGFFWVLDSVGAGRGAATMAKFPSSQKERT